MIPPDSTDPGPAADNVHPLPPAPVIDLHTFRPRDVAAVVRAHLEACRDAGILEIRVVHGRGIGQLRQTVHATLARLPWVKSYALAGEVYGGLGATWVRLHPSDSRRGDQPPAA